MDKIYNIILAGLINIIKEGFWGNCVKIRNAVRFIGDYYFDPMYLTEYTLIDAIDYMEEKYRNKSKKQYAFILCDDEAIDPCDQCPEDQMIVTSLSRKELNHLLDQICRELDENFLDSTYVIKENFDYWGEKNHINDNCENDIDDDDDDFKDDEEDEEDEEDDDFKDDDDFDFNDEDIDPMEVRRDAWGNLYTVGGQMWERAMNKRNDDDLDF